MTPTPTVLPPSDVVSNVAHDTLLPRGVRRVVREFVDFYPGNSKLPKPQQLSCSEILAINLTGRQPFARGFVKAVWIGETKLGERIVIKKPASNDSQTVASFNEMLKKEIDLVRQLRVNAHVMNYLGACRGIEMDVDQALAVEGPLLNWNHIVRSSLDWASRIKIAISLMELLQFMDRKRLVHCDWKADQVALNIDDMLVKLVDLKSLRTFSVNHGVDRGKNCTSLQHCIWASSCFKWQIENNYDMPELACDSKASDDGVRYCIGFESPSMLYGSTWPLLWPLLSQYLRQAPSTTFVADIDAILHGASMSLRRERWSASRVQRRLGEVFASNGGELVYGDGEAARQLLRNVLDDTIQQSAARCARRYC